MTQNHFIPRKAPTLFGAYRTGQQVKIQFETGGSSIWAGYLGSGRFTTAYVRGETVYLYTFHGDLSKSILAHAHREHPSPHIPKIQRLGIEKFEGHVVNVYSAKFYHKVVRTHLSPQNKELVTLLQELHDDAKHEFPGNIVRSYKASEFNRVITESERLPDEIREVLENLSQIALDWGDHYIFDNFHIRNLGLNGKGKIVLIDPMFDMEKIQRDHDYRRRSGKHD